MVIDVFWKLSLKFQNFFCCPRQAHGASFCMHCSLITKTHLS